MYSSTLHDVHKLALRNKRFERRLMTNPRAVLQKRQIPEAEISLIEECAPQNAYQFGMIIGKIEGLLYAPDSQLLN